MPRMSRYRSTSEVDQLGLDDGLEGRARNERADIVQHRVDVRARCADRNRDGDRNDPVMIRCKRTRKGQGSRELDLSASDAGVVFDGLRGNPAQRDVVLGGQRVRWSGIADGVLLERVPGEGFGIDGEGHERLSIEKW